ncbi:pilus assembly protein [Streptomyces sp. NBC_01381]|uniref:TadE family protein n=1 Tax=Streptomyces sp. NBC_01381 TaxID=2903845 RepID=UPI002251C4B3|nr:TadE family protein [Streptomyces sp. NBC_01381]MCX4673643.1 pilus assembly protein [Streptomyces sp. NBC_01381]
MTTMTPQFAARSRWWMRRWTRCRQQPDRGSGVLELAIGFPIVMLLMFSIIQGGLWFHAREVAAHAAQKGVDAGRSYDAAPGAGSDAANAFLTKMGGSLQHRSVAEDSDGDQVAVEVRGEVVTLIPGVTIAVRQRAQAPVEEFTP